MKYTALTVLLLIAQCSFSQTTIEWLDIDQGKKLDAVQEYEIANNSIILIDQSTTKPSGMKPTLISSVSEDEVSIKRYLHLKHMEVYKKFLKSDKYIMINDSLYNIHFDMHEEKSDFDKYSVTIYKTNINTLENYDEGTPLLTNNSTSNKFRKSIVFNENYFAIIAHGSQNSVYQDGKGIDVHVYSTQTFEHLYSESIPLSNNTEIGQIDWFFLDEKGDFYLNHMYASSAVFTYGDIRRIELIHVSKNETSKYAINMNEGLIGTKLIEANDEDQFMLVYSQKNGRFLLESYNIETTELIDSSSFSASNISEHINPEMWSEFLKKADNQKFVSTGMRSTTQSKFKDGSIFIGAETVFSAGEKNVANFIRVAFFSNLSTTGMIESFRPYSSCNYYIGSLIDNQDNIHIFANDFKENYGEKGKFNAMSKHYLTNNICATEVVLTKEHELIERHRLDNYFEDGECFYKRYSFQISDSMIVIGRFKEKSAGQKTDLGILRVK